jgi:hypothetical protein
MTDKKSTPFIDLINPLFTKHLFYKYKKQASVNDVANDCLEDIVIKRQELFKKELMNLKDKKISDFQFKIAHNGLGVLSWDPSRFPSRSTIDMFVTWGSLIGKISVKDDEIDKISTLLAELSLYNTIEPMDWVNVSGPWSKANLNYTTLTVSCPKPSTIVKVRFISHRKQCSTNAFKTSINNGVISMASIPEKDLIELNLPLTIIEEDHNTLLVVYPSLRCYVIDDTHGLEVFNVNNQILEVRLVKQIMDEVDPDSQKLIEVLD